MTVSATIFAGPAASDARDPYVNVDKRNPCLPDRFTLDHEGVVVHVAMAPFMWMRPWEGETTVACQLALREHATNAESLFVRWAGNYLACTMDELLQHVRSELACNGVARLREAALEWESVRSTYRAAIQAGDTQRELDAQHKAQGYRYKVNAVIHPAHGDDQSVVWYSKKKPTALQVGSELRKRGSVLLDHFDIHPLK